MTEPRESYAVVTSCSGLHASEIICQIIKSETLPEGRHIMEDIYAYPYTIDNKYYTADIEFCPLHKRTIGNETFADAVQAVIIHFDGEGTDGSFEKVHMWKDYFIHWNPEVRLLICDQCPDAETEKGVGNRQKVLEWCIENEFELVEFQDPENEEEELLNGCDNPENVMREAAFKRIRSALHAHQWSNLKLKDEDKASVSKEKIETIDNPSASCVADEQAVSVENLSLTSKDTKQNDTEDIGDDLLNSDDLALFGSLEQESSEGQSFEALFHRFKKMKEKAESISNHEQRKAYAEKIAVMFWLATGGDEDEVEGIDT